MSARAARRVERATRADDPHRQTEAAVDAFRRILRALRLAARKAELATGLSAAQLFVLSAVAETPGCSVNDIAASTMTDRSSAAAVVDRLAATGYVKRAQSVHDRRRASVSITPAGRRAMLRKAPAPTAVLIDGLRRLPPSELASLSSGLDALTRAMGIAHEPAGMLFEDAPARAVRRTDAARGHGR